MSWWKKKPKEELELKEEEREASLTTPFGGFRRKRTYGVKKNEDGLKTAKKPRIIEETASIAPEHYETIDLGVLQRKTIISLECRELEGNNFAYFILDDINHKRYKREGAAPNPLEKDTGDNIYKVKVTVPITGQYYLKLTSRATDYKRKVWYRVEIG